MCSLEQKQYIHNYITMMKKIYTAVYAFQISLTVKTSSVGKCAALPQCVHWVAALTHSDISGPTF